MDLIQPQELKDDRLDWNGRRRGPQTWSILNAAREGDTKRIRELLASDPELANASYWYTTPLHFAVREGHLETSEVLVAAGADLTHRSVYPGNDTLLQMAMDRGHAEVETFLRERLADQHGASGKPQAIHKAITAGDLDQVRLLLKAERSSADIGDHLGRKPLHYAVDAGSVEIAMLLIDHGATVDSIGFAGDDRVGGDGFRPIALALWHNPYWRQRDDQAMVEALLSRGAAYTITIASALGDLETVIQLLRHDKSLANHREPGGKRPLSAAAERGHEQIVRSLIEAGADPNLEEGSNCPRGYSLWAAAHFGHKAIAEMLLGAGADPNAQVESSASATESAVDSEMRLLLYRHGGRMGIPAHFWKGNVDTIAALLNEKPDLFDDQTLADAFTMCCVDRQEGLMHLLLARGMRVPSVVTSCQTYLWRAPDLARLLLEHGLDANLPNWQRVTPLHHMAASGQIEQAQLFLEFGADPSLVDEEYRSTPLGWAARCGQTDFADFLLNRAGIPKDVVLTQPEQVPEWAQPASWAKRRGHDEISRLVTA